jgi:hypothetical protein
MAVKITIDSRGLLQEKLDSNSTSEVLIAVDQLTVNSALNATSISASLVYSAPANTFSGSAPTTFQDALNRVAVALAGLLTGSSNRIP